MADVDSNRYIGEKARWLIRGYYNIIVLVLS